MPEPVTILPEISPETKRLMGFSIAVASALILTLVAQGSTWAQAYDPANGGGNARTPIAGTDLGLWNSPALMLVGYFGALFVGVTLVALALVDASGRRRSAALAGSAIAVQLVLSFAVAQRADGLLHAQGFTRTHFGVGLFLAVAATVLWAAALILAAWSPAGTTPPGSPEPPAPLP